MKNKKTDFEKYLEMLNRQGAQITISRFGGGLSTGPDGTDVPAQTAVTGLFPNGKAKTEIFQGHCRLTAEEANRQTKTNVRFFITRKGWREINSFARNIVNKASGRGE